MKCPKCNSELPDKAKFCLECGSNISSVSKNSGVEKDVSLSGLRTLSGPAAFPSPKPGDVSIGDIRTVGGIKPGDGSTVIKIIKDRYELHEEIGRGGFAVVYKGRDIKLDRTIAVKVLSPQNQSGGDSSAIERFHRESSIIASLNHRNILTVFDCDKDDDAGFFIVMEYIDGGTLRDYLKEKVKLEIAEAASLMKGICRGMSYAHRKNLVHRDLKPANIMLGHDGDELVPKIVDFGLARSGSSSELSQSGYGMGTPYYMPPEQRRDAKSVNHTADIYAIGKIFYELLTGEIPDNVDTEKLPPDCHGLGRIITRCVKSKPEERYFSVDELMAEIEKATSSSRIESSTETKITVDGTKVCPQCNTYNNPGTKFCVKCGTGLTRPCPECEAESSIHDIHCPSCGTDIEAFLTATSVLNKMVLYNNEKKWSRVVKEAALLSAAMSFPKEKGKKLISTVRELESTAKGKIEKEGKLRERIQSELDKKNYAPALKMAKELLDDNPEEIEYKELVGEIFQAYIKKKKMNAKDLSENKEYAKALAILEEILIENSADEECIQLKKEITANIAEISRLRRKRTLRNTAIGMAMVVVIVILAFAANKYSHYRTYKSNFGRAQSAFAAKDFGTAVKLCEEALKVTGYANDATAKKFGEEARVSLERKNKFDNAMSEGKKHVEEKDWIAAEKAFASAIAIPGYENDGEVCERLKKCKDYFAEIRKRNKVLFDKAVSDGTKALSAKDYAKALNIFEAALKIPGYENNETVITQKKYATCMTEGKKALDSKDWATAEKVFSAALAVPGYVDNKEALHYIKAAQEGLEIQRKQSETAWNETKTKVNNLLSDMKNNSINIAIRIESADSALALLQKMSELSDIPYLSDTSINEITQLKSEIVSLQSKFPRIPSGFVMVKEPASDTGGYAQEIRHKETGIKMVYVAPGEFMMGSPTSEEGRNNDEPQHKVKLTKGYYIGKYEMTQGQWEKVMKANPSFYKDIGKGAPVEKVSWNDCQSFCKKLGSGFRLPTEAEWDYAARGGNRSKGFIYSGSNNLDEVGWYNKNSDSTTHEVGKKKANELGIYDMSGNVSEWCEDWFGDYPQTLEEDPQGAKSGSKRVVRGGYGRIVDCCHRVAYRSSPLMPSDWNIDLGFRLALTVDP